MRTPLSRPAHLLLAGVLFSATPALAQPAAPRGHFTLAGGAEVEGEVQEMVTGDHVTLRLDSGEVRRIPWAEIVSLGGGRPQAESVPWPAPDRTVPTPTEATRVQLQQVSRQLTSAFSSPVLGRGLMVGAGFAFLSSGPLAVDVGFEPFRWMSVDVGAGYGAHLGPALREGLRFNWAFPSFGSHMVMRITAGAAFQQNFLPSATANDATQSYPGAPSVASWLIPYLGWDFLLWQNLGLRAQFGYGVLLNQGSYSYKCQAGAPCDQADFSATNGPSIVSGPTPLGVALHNIGPALDDVLEVIYRFDLGGSGPPRTDVPTYVAPVVGALQAAEVPLDATGSFESTGGVPGVWTMPTERCTSAMRRGFLAAELYSRALQEDTEVVVIGGVLDGPELLVRVPGAGKMVRVRRSDCATLEGDLHQSGTRRNSVPGVEGTVRVDCALPGGGRLTGASKFTCL